MSGSAAKKFPEVFLMCNNGFCGGNIWWIIILLLLVCNCGGTGYGLTNGCCGTGYGMNNGCGCERENNCGCC